MNHRAHLGGQSIRFTPLYYSVIESPLSSTNKIFYSHLLNLSNQYDFVFKTKADLGSEMGLDKDHIGKLIKELVEYGIVYSEPLIENGFVSFNVYVMLPNPLLPITSRHSTREEMLENMRIAMHMKETPRLKLSYFNDDYFEKLEGSSEKYRYLQNWGYGQKSDGVGSFLTPRPPENHWVPINKELKENQKENQKENATLPSFSENPLPTSLPQDSSHLTTTLTAPDPNPPTPLPQGGKVQDLDVPTCVVEKPTNLVDLNDYLEQDTIEDACKLAYRRKSGAKWLNIRTNKLAYVAQKLVDLESSYGREAVISGLLEFLGSDDKYLVQNRYAIGIFTKQASEWLQRASERLGDSYPTPSPKNRATVKPAGKKQVSSIVADSNLNLLIAKWDEKPHLPKAILSDYERKAAAERFKEKEFVDNLDLILSKCSNLRAGGKCDWILLGWILKDAANYKKILADQYGSPKKSSIDPLGLTQGIRYAHMKVGIKLLTAEQFKIQTGKDFDEVDALIRKEKK